MQLAALAEKLGLLLKREPRFAGVEGADALLGDARRLCAEFGAPATGTGQMLRWVADWVRSDGRSLGKPTKYESRSGRF